MISLLGKYTANPQWGGWIIGVGECDGWTSEFKKMASSAPPDCPQAE